MRIECPQCGKKCQVPEGAEGKTFRCPQCKNTFKATDASKEAPKPAAAPAKAAPPPAKAAPAKPAAPASRIAKAAPPPPPPPEPEESEPPEDEPEPPSIDGPSDEPSESEEPAAPPSEEPSEESTEAEAPPPPAEEPPKPPGGRRPSKMGTARFPPRTGTTRRPRPGAKPDAAAAAGGDAPPVEAKKGMSMVVIIIIAVVLLGGGGAGAYFMGLFGGGETASNTAAGNQPVGNKPPSNQPPANEAAKVEQPKGPDTSKGVYGVDWHPPLAKDVFTKEPDFKGAKDQDKTGTSTEKDVKMEYKVKVKWVDGKVGGIDGYWDDSSARRFLCAEFVAGADGKSWAGTITVTSAKGDKLEIKFDAGKIISATGTMVVSEKAEEVEEIRTAGRLRDGLQVLLDGAAKALTGYLKEE